MTIDSRALRTVGSMVALAAAVVLTLAPTELPDTEQKRSSASFLRTDAISRVARERRQSVVFLHTVSQASPEKGPPSELFTPQPPWILKPIQEGLGSGVVIDDSGLILTNAHVIEAADAIHIRTPDGDDGDATVIGSDRDSDLALVQVRNLGALRAAPLGDSDRVNVGDWVVAIGSPFGLHHTVTTGIVSAKARGMDDSGLEFLQTDAAINPGNSGGALFDLTGALIGITTAILSGAGENIGLNFAIPINAVKEVLPQLRKGDVTHGWLGIRTLTLTRTGARALGVESGLVVIQVAPASPAARAGMRPGDVVLGIAGGSPAVAKEVHRRVRNTSPGTRVTLRVWRDQTQIEMPVDVGTRPREP